MERMKGYLLFGTGTLIGIGILTIMGYSLWGIQGAILSIFFGIFMMLGGMITEVYKIRKLRKVT